MRKYFLLLTLAVMLAACGLKGPLYLPKPGATPPAAAANTQADDKKKSPESK